MADGVELSVELVRQLLREQFPHWADLDVREVASQGWDNRTFRLGPELSVRLPSAEGYAPQVGRDHHWLPVLGRALSTPVPSPVAMGAPSPSFPWAWSVNRWLDGTPLDEADGVDLDGLARDVASFLRALRSVPVPPDAPLPQASNGFRGGPFERYLAEGLDAVSSLAPPLRQQARQWLHEAAGHPWTLPPVWVHGDMSSGNLLVRDGRLCAVIDFGCLAVGDPACDLTAAWTIFDESGREAFRRDVGYDTATWRRARGWAVWKAAITIASEPEGSTRHHDAQRTLGHLWSDELRSS